MTDREKLSELLNENFCKYCNVDIIAGNCKISAITFDVDRFADFLIANGVTFATDNNVGSKWIPASEPPKKWKDENGDAINYLIYSPGIGVDIGNWIQPAKAWFCLGVPFKVTHWMLLPEPPKEDAK